MNGNASDISNNSVKENIPSIKTKKIIFRKNNVIMNNCDNILTTTNSNTNSNTDLKYINIKINKMNKIYKNNFNLNIRNNSSSYFKYPYTFNSSPINNINNNTANIDKMKIEKIKEIEQKIKIEENKLNKLKEEKDKILYSDNCLLVITKNNDLYNDMGKIENNMINIKIDNNCESIKNIKINENKEEEIKINSNSSKNEKKK